MTKVIRRSALPQSADDYHVSPPVQVSHRPASHVIVKTFCGVEVKCRIMSSREVKAGTIYAVKPVENRWKDFKQAGVPATQDDAMNEFTAFDWQISPCRNT